MFQLQWERSLVRSIGLLSVGKRRGRGKENEGDDPDIVGLVLAHGHPVVGHQRTDIGDPTERADDIDDQSQRTVGMLTVDEDTLTTRMTTQREIETETDQETRTERGRGNQSMM